MEKNDTVKLLEECNLGTKMAVESIDEVISKVCNNNLKQILTQSKSHHQELGNQIHKELLQNGAQEKDPSPIAKGMSWMKTNIMMTLDKNDDTIAELIFDGCNMGVKSLNKYLNDFQSANDISKDLCKQLINIEKTLATDLGCYL